jgi:hypothetical protein
MPVHPFLAAKRWNDVGRHVRVADAHPRADKYEMHCEPRFRSQGTARGRKDVVRRIQRSHRSGDDDRRCEISDLVEALEKEDRLMEGVCLTCAESLPEIT